MVETRQQECLQVPKPRGGGRQGLPSVASTTGSICGVPLHLPPPLPQLDPTQPPTQQSPQKLEQDFTLREGQEAVMKQKTLGRVAELETPGVEVPPPARPLL